MREGKTANVAAYFANVVMDFRDAEREAPERLPVHERDKISDLLGDVRDYGARLDQGTWLGCVFARFERVAGLSVPYIVAHPIRWFRNVFLRKRRPRRKPLDCHAPQPDAQHDTIAFADDFVLFDRLSLVYGGKFRGSIVANYALGILASGILVFSLTIGHTWPGPDRYLLFGYLPLASLFEFFCLAVIGGVYCIGATPETDEARPFWAPRWSWQRWHERWLEYRLIAERFRYLDLLLPFGADDAKRISIAPGNDADKMWHQRYFEWRIGNAVSPDVTVRAYHKHVLAVMIEQERYHAHNYFRRGSIADGLHSLAVGLFICGLFLCVVNFLVESGCTPNFSFSCCFERIGGEVIVFLAAMLPIVSAAIHGILANTEYTKVADTSGDVAHTINGLVEILSAMPVADDWDDEKGLQPMRVTVHEFVEVVLNEATGWRSMLRDKNVPLA